MKTINPIPRIHPLSCKFLLAISTFIEIWNTIKYTSIKYVNRIPFLAKFIQDNVHINTGHINKIFFL